MRILFNFNLPPLLQAVACSWYCCWYWFSCSPRSKRSVSKIPCNQSGASQTLDTTWLYSPPLYSFQSQCASPHASYPLFEVNFKLSFKTDFKLDLKRSFLLVSTVNHISSHVCISCAGKIRLHTWVIRRTFSFCRHPTKHFPPIRGGTESFMENSGILQRSWCYAELPIPLHFYGLYVFLPF